MQGMAQYGRNGDTMMAHVAPGEMVVPQEVLQENPQVARGLGMAFADAGADPLRYTVGSGQNSINPVTGEPEFFLGDLLKKGLKYGSKLMSGGGGSFLSNPIVQGAISNVALQALSGNKPSLRDALIGGVAGGGLGYLSGGDSGLGALFGMDVEKVGGPDLTAFGGPTGDALTEAIISSKQKTKPVTRGENLMGIGELLGTNPNEGLGRILNTPIGESLAFGLGSKVFDMLFPPDDTETDEEAAARRFNQSYAERRSDPRRLKLANTRRPSGTAQQIEQYLAQSPYPESSVMQLNQGGPAYFPRRDGGIMPDEGSGRDDDVPAMLTAGEFVMTRDAVKGAGNGDLNRGIQNMYGVMNDLERKA